MEYIIIKTKITFQVVEDSIVLYNNDITTDNSTIANNIII